MGYSKGRERLYKIIDATRIWDIVKGGKDYHNINDATKIWDIVKGGKGYIT